MAVDTAAKRYSANAQRWGRLPFGRRFSPPLPDGTVGQGDRQHLAWAYSGIMAGAIVDYVPAFWALGQVYRPGFREGQNYLGGFPIGQTYLPGLQEGDVV